MHPFLIALAAFGQTATAAPAPAVPPDVMFMFYKVFALRQMTHDRGCSASVQDARYEAIRRRLIDHYGPAIFSPKKQPALPGDCGVVMVYDRNLGELDQVATTFMTPAKAN